MELEKKIQNLMLIDHFLVLVDESEDEVVTKSGIILAAQNKTPNYGTVVKTPDSLIVRDDTSGYNILQLIKPGATVFFPVNVSVNYIEFPELPAGKKLILLNKDHIQAFYNSGDEVEV